MEQGEGGKDKLATSLQDQLKKFASSETKDREGAIVELVAFIKANADREVMDKLVDKEFQPKLEASAIQTLETQFKRYDGTLVEKVWEGGYTVVALTENGEVKGASTIEGSVWKAYGDLNKYALIKALCELHLYKANRFGGLSDPDNFKYLVGLGLKPDDGKEDTDPDLFTGSTKAVAVGDDVLYVASSGAAADRSYLTELLAGGEPKINTQAGLFDSVFSRFTASYLRGETQTVFPEPREIQQLRINN